MHKPRSPRATSSLGWCAQPHSASIPNGKYGGDWVINYCGLWYNCGKFSFLSRKSCMDWIYSGYSRDDLASLPCSHKTASFDACCDGPLKKFKSILGPGPGAQAAAALNGSASD